MQAEHSGSVLYRLSRVPHAGHNRGSAIPVQPSWCRCYDTKRERYGLAMPKCHDRAAWRAYVAPVPCRGSYSGDVTGGRQPDHLAGATRAGRLSFTAGAARVLRHDQRRCQPVMTLCDPALTGGHRDRGRLGANLISPAGTCRGRTRGEVPMFVLAILILSALAL